MMSVSSKRWTVRKARRRDGSNFKYLSLWDVYDADGSWSGIFESWGEAMAWADECAGARYA